MRVCIVGLGKLGAVMAGVFADAGHDVIGVDVSEAAVELVNRGVAPVAESGLQELYDGCRLRLEATTNWDHAVAHSDIAFVIVPTPSGPSGAFDASLVVEAVKELGTALRNAGRHQYVVVISSTVMPGTCDDLVRPALDDAAGAPIELCYSPEFIALGSVIEDMRNPDMMLIGQSDATAGAMAWLLLDSIVDSDPAVFRMSLVDAELAKLSVNAFVTMKISFANQLAEMAERIPTADAAEVLLAIGEDRRIGSRYLRPGGPFGGPCFPRDNRAYQALARAYGVSAPLARATDEINRRVLERTLNWVPDGARVAVLGLTYKPFTPVMEHAFGVGLLEHLPPGTLSHDPTQPGRSAQEVLEDADVVIVATAWPEYRDLEFGDRLVIDVWGHVTGGTNVVRLGVN